MLYRELADKFLERVQQGHVCIGAQHSMMSPQLVEMYGLAGLDFVVIGTEVEAIDKSMIENLMRAAAASRTVPIIKLAHADARLVSETLNYGAPLVLTPHITSAKQLEEMVAASKFTPVGTRGECPVARYTSYGVMNLDDSRDLGNASVSIIPIIEDREALENIEEIAAVEGVNLFEIGPFDFSRSLGEKIRGPAVIEAVDHLVATIRKHGKHVMMPMWVTPQLDSLKKFIDWQVEKLVSRGVTVLFQPDVHVLSDHYRSLMYMRSIRVNEEEVDESAESSAQAT